MNYIKEVKTPFNIEFGAREGGKTIFLLDKVFGNPRVYLQGVPPSGELNEYYTKPEMNDILSTNYWTKQEVAQAIAEIQTMDIEVLSELPPIEEAQEYTIYLVPAPSSEIGNFYDEYLVINQQFEQVGSTAVDLSDYVKTEDLSGYMPTSGRIMRTGPFTLNGAYQDSQSLFVVTNYGVAVGLLSNAGNYGGAVAVGYKCTAGQYAQVFGSECSSTGLNLNNTLFGFGLILLVLGIIGNYLSEIYLEIKQRPKYIIKDTSFKEKN